MTVELNGHTVTFALCCIIKVVYMPDARHAYRIITEGKGERKGKGKIKGKKRKEKGKGEEKGEG